MNISSKYHDHIYIYIYHVLMQELCSKKGTTKTHYHLNFRHNLGQSDVWNMLKKMQQEATQIGVLKYD